MNRTDIEYLDLTWNPIVGCTNGCSYCWARRQAKRQKHNCRKCYAFTPHLHPDRLDEPLRKREPSTIGVCFMGDLFDLDIGRDEWLAVWTTMVISPQHTFVVLTKRPDVARRRISAWMKHVRGEEGLPPENIVLGISITDQPSADRLISELMKCQAATRIVSIEPMHGPVQFALGLMDDGVFTKIAACPNCGAERPDVQAGLRGPIRQVVCQRCGHADGAAIFLKQGLDGVIVGGQTGPGAVPTHPDWVRAVRDQCQAAGVPFFFKQWGEWHPVSEYNFSTEMWRHGMIRVGRKRAGRTLDGRTHDELAWGKGRLEARGLRVDI